jgi:peptidoglycan/LPS O-acetylase OafA/YrhL
MVFFCISGRILVASYIKSGKSSSLASAIIRRPFRLGLPVFGVLMLSYYFALSGGILFPWYREYTSEFHTTEWGSSI